jgi:RNA polymerase primary sigma factor
MATKIKVSPQNEEMPKKECPETPLLDLSDAAVKDLIRSAKKRGYVTYDQINALLSSQEVKSEQIEDILAKFSEMGVNVVDTKEAELEEEVATREVPEEEADSESELVEVQQRPIPAKSQAKDPAERTDDPERMYLREMGSMELLSREGEIAIAKRIEAGRETMIAGLCESPLTFQAIIIWREELNDGKVLLRDIIDLDATYAGPDDKAISMSRPLMRFCVITA